MSAQPAGEEWDFAAAARAGQPGPAAMPIPDWREDTITSFPAIRDEDAPEDGGKCECGMPGCPDAPPAPRPAGAGIVLSCAEGVTSRIWRTRTASGEWDDIPAEADRGHARIHLPALETNRRIRADVAGGLLDIGAVLRADPPALGDPQLDRDLCRIEASLAEQAGGLRWWVAYRAEETRREAAREAAA